MPDVNNYKYDRRLDIFSNGSEEVGYISVHLHHENNELNAFHTTHQLGISSTKKDRCRSIVRTSKKDWDTWSWGEEKFISHAGLLNPDKEYLSDGKLKIFCKVYLSLANE